MLVRRVIALLAVSVGVVGVVSCSSENQVSSIGYATDAQIASYNAGTALGASSGAAAILPRVLTGFFYTGPDGQPIADTDVGTAKEVPGESQTIQYRLHPDGVYSDGVPTSCDDLVLTWAARRGKYTRDDANGPVPLFAAASTAGYADIERVECVPGSKDATVVMRPGRRFNHWRTLFNATDLMPAHIAARVAGIPNVVSAVQEENPEVLARLAEFWNTGWNLTPGELDLSVLPASGPYRIESFTKDNGLILVANERWWGNKPATGRIVIWPRSTDLAARIEEGNIAVVDIGAGMVADLDLSSFTSQELIGRGAEQLILRTTGVFATPVARSAFAHCVPRRALFTSYGTLEPPPESGPGAAPLDAHLVPPDSMYYPAVTGAAEPYQEPDPAAAKAAALTGPVRIGYRLPDARRAAMVAEITKACAAAGITVQDAGAQDFSPSQLAAGTVDAMLSGPGGAVGPAGANPPVAASSALRSGAGLNFGGFSSERYDAITQQLAADDNSAAQLGLLTELETLLWTQVPNIPLFLTPRSIAFADGLHHGLANPTQAGTGWNMDRWVLKR